MKDLKVGVKNVKFYDSIKELPIDRYNALQGYLMQDAGIGSTMQDVEAHYRNLDMFLTAGKIQEAVIERQNLHLNFFAAINNINFKSLSFACLIYTINKEVIGCTETELNEALSKLEDLKYADVQDILDSLKKNFVEN